MESENFCGESAWKFCFKSLNHGSKYFLREGEVRNSMRTKFYRSGRGRKPKGHSTLHIISIRSLDLTHIFFYQLFGFLYKRGRIPKGRGGVFCAVNGTIDIGVLVIS